MHKAKMSIKTLLGSRDLMVKVWSQDLQQKSSFWIPVTFWTISVLTSYLLVRYVNPTWYKVHSLILNKTASLYTFLAQQRQDKLYLLIHLLPNNILNKRVNKKSDETDNSIYRDQKILTSTCESFCQCKWLANCSCTNQEKSRGLFLAWVEHFYSRGVSWHRSWTRTTRVSGKSKKCLLCDHCNRLVNIS